VPQPAMPIGEGEEYELRSPDEPVYNLDDPREADIVAWRVACFERAGLTNLDACVLAVRRDVDRQRVEDILAAGATSALVREIVR